MTNRLDGKTPPEPFEQVHMPPSRVWRDKYDCKRNKGDHTFEIQTIRAHTHNQLKSGLWVEKGWKFTSVTWQCSACKKLASEFKAPQKKFDKYRHTIYELQRQKTI